MDELIKKRVRNTIGQLGTKVINTKYLPTYMNHDNFKISQMELEDYLENEDYISISDNYMFYRSAFVKYCTVNNLNTISKLKKYIFIDYGVPYITLLETQLQDILKNDLEDNSKDKYTYSSNELVRKNIIAEYLGESFSINNRRDLIEYGLKKTYISYELLEDFCDINPNENSFEIIYLLQDRDIKLSSKKVEYYITCLDEVGKVAEEQEEAGTNIAGTYFEDFDILTPREMISTLEDLGREDKIVFDKIDFLNKHGYFYVKRIVNTGILNEFNDIFFVSPYAQILIKKIKDDKAKCFLYKKEPGRYSKKINIQEFCDKYKDTIASTLLQNGSVRKLISILKKANKQNKKAMQEIAYYCYDNGLEKLFLNMFIGKRPTNGIKPLKEFTDVCFSCTNIDKCIGESVRNKNKSYISEVLFRYMDKHSKDCLRFITKENKIDILIQKPIYLKFLASYKLVVSTKLLLKQFNLIEDDKILYKDKGKYCPQKDIWRVKNDILV